MVLTAPEWPVDAPTDWPGHTLRGPKGSKVAQTGLSGVELASQLPVRASRGQSDTAKTTSGHS